MGCKSEAQGSCYPQLAVQSLHKVMGSRCGPLLWPPEACVPELLTAQQEGQEFPRALKARVAKENGLLGLPDVQQLVSSRRWGAPGGPCRLRQEGRVLNSTGFVPKG